MIIGVSGKAGSGKDAAAKYLIDNYGFIRYAFAEKLKSIAYDLFGVEYDNKDERGREVYQQLGEKMREIDNNVWINYVMKSIAKRPIDQQTRNVVITDVRHVNEVQSIEKAGGMTIRVSRPDVDRLAYLTKKYGGYSQDRLNHVSETQLDAYSGYIYHIYAESLEKLYAELDVFMVNVYYRHEKVQKV